MKTKLLFLLMLPLAMASVCNNDDTQRILDEVTVQEWQPTEKFVIVKVLSNTNGIRVVELKRVRDGERFNSLASYDVSTLPGAEVKPVLIVYWHNGMTGQRKVLYINR